MPRGWVLPSKTLEGVRGVNPCGGSYKTFVQTTLKSNVAQAMCM